MGFPRQEYWSCLSFPSSENIPDPDIKPESPVLQVSSLPLSHGEAPKIVLMLNKSNKRSDFECKNQGRFK